MGRRERGLKERESRELVRKGVGVGGQGEGGVILENDVCISLFKPECSARPRRCRLSCVCIQARVHNTRLCWVITSELCVIIYT